MPEDRGTPARTSTPAQTFAPRLVQFLAVARCENVSRAAELLEVGQPMLSRAITRLEADLGLALFNHQGRRLKLTPAGRELATMLEPVARQIDRAVHQLGGSVDPRRGQVRFGFLRSMGDEVVPTMISAFGAREPEIEFTLLKEGSNAELVASLRAAEIDLALLAPAPKEPDITSELLETQRLHLEVPANHPLAALGSTRFEDLAGWTFVALTGGYGLRQILDALCESAGFRPRIVFQGDDIRTLRALVASCAGIALLPPAARPQPGTTVIPVIEPVPTREVCLAWSSTSQLSAPAETFRAFMIAQRGHVFP
ncbi:LysR family transcriptional regulator [Streptomyces sp. NPDC101455]|uniref:LysR family transcriptional regulator n=1 Tax=Streptomyces sp. NPDC101455 TaxID=3366142 RepID=UPI0037FC4073